MSFFTELKRRNVVRVAIAYIIVGWLVFQIGEVLFPTFGAPEWVFKTIILIVALGFPIALIFAWAFELTSDGIKKTADVDVDTSVTGYTGRKLDFFIIGALVLALAYFVWERQALIDATEEMATAVVESQVEEAAEIAEEIEEEPDRSIAVIPFVNMSSDEDQEWFADGLTEEILNSLARTPDLKVTARTSSFAYKGSGEDVPTIAAALGVAHILEGSVRRSGDRIRVTAQLIRADDGFHLWSETFDRNVEDLIDIQENVAIEIAKALETAMDPEALAHMVESGTASVPAFEAYLQGLSFGLGTSALGDPYSYLEVRYAYERAIELDPEFARAYWGLALFWAIQLDTTLTISGITELPTDEIRENYFQAINSAIEHESNETNVLLYKASKARTESRPTRAARYLAEFVENRPNDQDGNVLYLVVLAEIGDIDKLVDFVAAVRDRDWRSTGFAITSMSAILFSSDNDLIREYAHTYMDQYPDHIGVTYQAHRMLLWVGDIDGASRLAPRIIQSEMGSTSMHLVSLRQACADNRLEDARRIYAKGMVDYPDEESIIWLSHMMMGNLDEATASLMPFDTEDDLKIISSFLNYSWFDASFFPNLSAMLEQNDIVRPAPKALPYQCRI